MEIVFLFYENMTALDAVGPYEVLSRLPNAKSHFTALKPGPIHTDAGLTLQADVSIFDITHADLLVVPGGGNATTLKQYPELLAHLYKLHQKTTWTASICTGSLILGAAGILRGIRATSHWAAHDRLAAFGAIPVNERVVIDGKIITGAGVSAGIDLALTLAAKIAGTHIAESLQLGIEYDPQPPFNSGTPDKASPQIVEPLRARLLSRFES